MIPKVKIRLYQIFYLFFSIIFAFITVSVLTLRGNTFYQGFKPLVILILSIIFIIFLYLLYRISYKVPQKYFIFIILFYIFTICLLQILFVVKFKVNPSWDYGTVYNQAISLAQGETKLSEYFYGWFPNNIPLVIFLALVYKILILIGVKNFLIPTLILNCMIILISIILIFLLLKKLYGYNVIIFSGILCVFMTPFYTYAPIAYTDTLAMIFPIIICYLYSIYNKSNGIKNLSLLLLISFLMLIGFLVKMNVIIIFVALIITLVLFEKSTQVIKAIIISLVVIFTGIFFYKSYAEQLMPVDYSEAGFPVTHWIMMGLTGNGGFNMVDSDYTIALKREGLAKNDIANEHLSVIKQRISNFGTLGLSNHIRNKILYTWGDGTFFAPEKLRREPLEQSRIQSYIYGNENTIYIYFAQVVWCVILISITIGGVVLFFKFDPTTFMINLTIFGCFLFLIIWEARSRYLILFIPLFIVSANYGLISLFKKIDVFLKNEIGQN